MLTFYFISSNLMQSFTNLLIDASDIVGNNIEIQDPSRTAGKYNADGLFFVH